MRQLSLIPKQKYRKRKVARAIAVRRGANHIVLKARVPLLRKNRDLVMKSIRDTQDRFGIRLRALAVMPDHLHLIARVATRRQFADALRMLAGTIARRIMKKGALWRARAWSRVVTAGRDLETVTMYVLKNPLKARIDDVLDAFWLKDGILQL